MRPNIYLYRDENITTKTWNLRPKTLTDYNGLFIAMEGAGFETKNSYTRVDNDFVLTEQDPQQEKISGTMYFRTEDAIQSFGEFCGNFDGEMKLYYDPNGIRGEDELSEIYYKTVRITKFDNPEMDNKTACFKVKVEFTPDSAMWKLDREVSSSFIGTATDIHIYNYEYNYFYTSGENMVAAIRNEGTKTGCKITIYNGTGQELTYIQWTCVGEDGTIQYAQFDIMLPAGATLVVDSNALTQGVTYIDGNGTESDVQSTQYPAPSYINFIQLHSGDNTITFGATAIEGLEITISYAQQTRAL